ncbi:MAG: adenylyl-sulfate kinase [Patescibacteria group bacterium]|jgi:adenylylsulfate kinase
MITQPATNITWHHGRITRQNREQLLKQTAQVLWFTGLSGSGKSTLSVALEERLFAEGKLVYRLDGDNIRHGLNKNLGFSPPERTENIRRIGEVAKLFVDSGVIVLTAFVSPYQADRDLVRALFASGEFIEIYTKCSLAGCEQRDTKGLYAKAKAGQIKDFTGISAPYEAPEHSEIVIDTEKLSINESVDLIIKQLGSSETHPQA